MRDRLIHEQLEPCASGNGGASDGLGAKNSDGTRGDDVSATLTNYEDGARTEVIGSASASPLGAAGEPGGACV